METRFGPYSGCIALTRWCLRLLDIVVKCRASLAAGVQQSPEGLSVTVYHEDINTYNTYVFSRSLITAGFSFP